MSGRLKVGQWCPLHRSKTCPCHPEPVVRERKPKIPTLNGVKRFPDGREVCSPAALKRRKDRLVRTDERCRACGQEFTEYDEIELAHEKSKGSGGFKRDDSWPNLYLMHKSGNREQGSRSLEQYLSDCLEKGVKPCQQ